MLWLMLSRAAEQKEGSNYTKHILKLHRKKRQVMCNNLALVCKIKTTTKKKQKLPVSEGQKASAVVTGLYLES